jgi:serine/threonine protein kinase
MNWQVTCLVPFQSGGNGDVYLGRKSDTNEHVAVKFLRDSNIPHLKKGFTREVRVLARQLDGMVPILGWNMNADRPFYVMRYLRRGNLSQHAGKLSDTTLHAVATQLARTLANLHCANEIHGDLKPDNILVTEEGQLQVADPLGIGTLFTVLFSENRGGTPGYWAPEIAAGASISQAGDVYSYGATLYHLLTACAPKDGQQLDLAVRRWERAPAIREVIAACCQRDPVVRPTIQEVLRLLNGDSWVQIEKSRQQQKQLTGVFALGLLGLLAFALAA